MRCRQSSDPAGVLQTTKQIRRYIVGSNHSFHRRFRRELCHFRKELAVKLRKARQKRKAYKRRKPACRLIFLAQREGFEPSWDCSQTDFEGRETAKSPYISAYCRTKCSLKIRKIRLFCILLFVSATSYKAVFHVWAPLGHHRHHNGFNSWCFPLLFAQSIIYIVCFCLDNKYYFILV